MEKLKVVLSSQDVSLIVEALLNVPDTDINDSDITDVFCTLYKMGGGVKMTSTPAEDVMTAEDEDVMTDEDEDVMTDEDLYIRSLADTVLKVLEEVGDITDLKNDPIVEPSSDGYDSDGYDSDDSDGYDSDVNELENEPDRDKQCFTPKSWVVDDSFNGWRTS